MTSSEPRYTNHTFGHCTEPNMSTSLPQSISTAGDFFPAISCEKTVFKRLVLDTTHTVKKALFARQGCLFPGFDMKIIHSSLHLRYVGQVILACPSVRSPSLLRRAQREGGVGNRRALLALIGERQKSHLASSSAREKHSVFARRGGCPGRFLRVFLDRVCVQARFLG